MFTIAYCLSGGLGLGLGLHLVSCWLVVMHTYLYYFRLSLSHCLSTSRVLVSERLILYTQGGPKKWATTKMLKKSYKIISKPVNEIRFIRQWPSTIISFVGIRYSMRGLLSDLNNYMPDPLTSDVRQIGKWCKRFLWQKLSSASCKFCV